MFLPPGCVLGMFLCWSFLLMFRALVPKCLSDKIGVPKIVLHLFNGFEIFWKTDYQQQCSFVLSILVYLIPWIPGSIWSLLALGSSNANYSFKWETYLKDTETPFLLLGGWDGEKDLSFSSFPPFPRSMQTLLIHCYTMRITCE